jgi:RNA-directed DNA polymerase
MTLWNETRTVPISRTMIWAAYKRVKANDGGAGVDALSIDEFDKERSKHLYKLWNRLSSGSYFPPAVKEVAIPKKDGKMRLLGIPTVADRIAQMAIKEYLEPRFEKIFSDHSYGYRPMRNAHQAIAQVRENVRISNWVIDLDIKGFFDNINHEKLMLAVQKHVPEKWANMYILRWLNSPVHKESGELVYKQGKGTPQGGVISPLLANLFLHYTFDKWLEIKLPHIKFVRYADDAIIHCTTQAQAQWVLKQLHQRMHECCLELHPEKTKIVYCKDYRRQGEYEQVKFDFLGYTFQPRSTQTVKAGQSSQLFLGFDCAISTKSYKSIAEKLREMRLEKATSFKSIVGVAYVLNPYIRGWVNYYGKFRMSELSKVHRLIQHRIIRWARKKYKRYKTTLTRAFEWLKEVRKQFPYLFYHWQFGFSH